MRIGMRHRIASGCAMPRLRAASREHRATAARSLAKINEGNGCRQLPSSLADAERKPRHCRVHPLRRAPSADVPRRRPSSRVAGSRDRSQPTAYLTERVKSPGLDLLLRTRKEPSLPRSSSMRSASTPETLGWNHLPIVEQAMARRRSRWPRQTRRVVASRRCHSPVAAGDGGR